MESMPGKAGRPNTYDLTNRYVFHGRLGDLLARWRADGLTLDGITRRLREDHGVIVSYATVRRWLIRDGLLTVKERAS